MDTKFSVALHILAFISETDEVTNSKRLAKSVQTNASHIRKITTMLKKAGIIDSHQGKSGFHLVKSKENLTLKDIYQAIYPDKVLLHIHGEPNRECPVGARIGQVLSPVFEEAEASLLKSLDQLTLADLIQQMYAIK